MEYLLKIRPCARDFNIHSFHWYKMSPYLIIPHISNESIKKLERMLMELTSFGGASQQTGTLLHEQNHYSLLLSVKKGVDMVLCRE